ncbi:MAG: hypothetical protein FK733_18200 [Asgard group archaeon]|nr:hypothetical protein [Asgard group archaeon]
MSGYIHKIGFKVLVDSEVIDFTFNVPRGTLLVQILDELETTLQIKPHIIAVINHYGEIVVIENHYSTIDFLTQKFGTEYYAGETRVVTFNHGEFIVDLEVPVAIPFAATYRTACKSFTLKTIDVSIERQDGQIMDDEVFGMPTAFVLNSWGNFYRIVDKEFGDTLSEVLEQEATIETTQKEPSEPMVYPPELDKPLPDAQPLVETSPEIESQIDKMTDNFIDKQSAEIETEEVDVPFITQPVDEEQKLTVYPWKKETDLEKVAADEEIESLKQLIDNLTLDDEIIEEEAIEQPVVTTEPFVDEPIIELPQADPPVDEGVVEEVFKGIFADEEREQSIRETPVEEIEEDKVVSDVDEVSADEILTFDDETIDEEIDFEEEEEDEIIDSYDFPVEEEEDEQIIEEHIDELDDIDDEIVDISSEEELEDIPSDDVEEIDGDVTTTIESAKELLDRVDALTSAIIGDDETETSPPILEQPVTDELEEPELSVPDDDLPLNERLEIRKKELSALETALKTQEERIEEKVSQRSVIVEYYERMIPQKIFPLIVKIPPTENNSGKNTEIKVQPVFPGCHVMPSEEILDLYCDKLTEIEFNVTPLVRRGKIAGKVNLWHKKRNLISIVTSSKVLNHFWTYFTGILAFAVGLLPIIIDLIAGTNTLLAGKISATMNPMILFWIELSVLIVLTGITIGLAIGKKAKKQLKTRKFFPNVNKDED